MVNTDITCKFKNTKNINKYLIDGFLSKMIYLLSNNNPIKINIGIKYLPCTPSITIFFTGVHCTYKLENNNTIVKIMLKPIKTLDLSNFLSSFLLSQNNKITKIIVNIYLNTLTE